MNKGIMGQMTKARLTLVFLNAMSCWLKSNEHNARDREFLALRVWVCEEDKSRLL